MVCVRLSLESFAVVPVVSAPTVAPASPPTLPPINLRLPSPKLRPPKLRLRDWPRSSDRDQACSVTDTEGESVLALVLPYTTNFCA